MKKLLKLKDLQCSSFITKVTNTNMIIGATTGPTSCGSDDPPPLNTTQGETN